MRAPCPVSAEDAHFFCRGLKPVHELDPGHHAAENGRPEVFCIPSAASPAVDGFFQGAYGDDDQLALYPGDLPFFQHFVDG